MSTNRGKSFEDKVEAGISELGDVYIQRLYDPQGGYSAVCNPCDYVAYKKPKFYMLECKSTHENTLSIYGTDPKKKYGKISNTQWEGMLYATQFDVVAGVICWWVEKDITKFMPIQELKKYRDAGNKSIRYDYDLPNSLIIKGEKLRVFFKYDFTEFFEKYY